MLEAYYCAGAPEKARQIYGICHAREIPMESPCANYLEKGMQENAEAYARNREALLKNYNPVRNIDLRTSLSGHSMDDPRSDFLLQNKKG